MARISTLSLNMQNGQFWDPDNPDDCGIRIQDTIDFLLERDADIIFLQEVEFPSGDYPDTDHHPNYDKLSQALSNYDSYFSLPLTNHPQLPFGIGLAIFSKFPLMDSTHIVLPAEDIEIDYQSRRWHLADRSLIRADINLDGHRIRLLNTHLQAYFVIGRNADDHPDQRDEVKHQVVLGYAECGEVLLAGDFNCAPGEHSINSLMETGLISANPGVVTWRRLPYSLDHIMYSRGFNLESFEAVDNTISDHLPVLAELEI